MNNKERNKVAKVLLSAAKALEASGEKMAVAHHVAKGFKQAPRKTSVNQNQLVGLINDAVENILSAGREEELARWLEKGFKGSSAPFYQASDVVGRVKDSSSDREVRSQADNAYKEMVKLSDLLRKKRMIK